MYPTKSTVLTVPRYSSKHRYSIEYENATDQSWALLFELRVYSSNRFGRRRFADCQSLSSSFYSSEEIDLDGKCSFSSEPASRPLHFESLDSSSLFREEMFFSLINCCLTTSVSLA